MTKGQYKHRTGINKKKRITNVNFLIKKMDAPGSIKRQCSPTKVSRIENIWTLSICVVAVECCVIKFYILLTKRLVAYYINDNTRKKNT